MTDEQDEQDDRVRAGGEVWTTRIPFHDVDMTGLVHNSVYLEYCETAINEFIRLNGLKAHFVVSDRGWAYHVRRTELVFSRPSTFDDVLTFAVRIARLGGTSITFEVYIAAPAETSPRVTGSVTWVCVDVTQSAARSIPDDARAALEPFRASVPPT